MLFCSRPFVYFFAVVLAAYWALPWPPARRWLLLAASFYFYASWSPVLACLVLATATLDYACALGMARRAAGFNPAVRRLLLAASLGTNLGALAYFKYAGFFLASLAALLDRLGLPCSLPVLSVLAPVGISFYTFEAVSYTVDVYRGRLAPERDLSRFLLFILFFPHLVAGPIVRAGDFLPQTRKRIRWSWPRAQRGVELFMLGLVKKLLIADRMAAFVDPVFAHPDWYKTSAIWLAVLAYAVQIYGDFSGYSDMAVGAAHLLGYRLTRNFDAPYLSRNIAEFWRRWHGSLGRWLKDYVFVPLGGSRAGRWVTARNLLIVMTLGGLWHGAHWPYVLFGVVHGGLLVGHRLFRALVERWPQLDRLLQTPSGTTLRIAVTFVVFCCTLAVFRPESLADVGTVWLRMIVPMSGKYPVAYRPLLWYALAFVFGCQLMPRLRPRRGWRACLPGPVVGLGYAAAWTAVLLLTPEAGKSFIYFQF